MEQIQDIQEIQGLNEINETPIDKEVKEALKNEVNTVPYKPMSTLPSLGTVIPISFLGETIEAQSKVLASIGMSIDDFLMKKLKYRSKIALGEAFAAEQADAIGMAIYQIENNESLILADQAGTGKGRVCAGILRYAFTNGYLPIFITEKDNLFTDIYRDIVDIGGIGALKREQKYFGTPLILNGYKSGGKELGEDGKKKSKPSPTSILNDDGEELIVAPEIDEINKIIKTGELPDKYDFIVLTYSQLAAPKSGLKKYEYLLEAAKNGKGKFIIVMDECHNASGTKSATGEKIRGLVTQSNGCLFSSATFSKTPENMYLYSLKNDLRKANVPTDELLDIIKKGQERLIENMAANLAQAGQLLRRERRFDNCIVEYKFMEESDKEQIFEKYDKTLSIYRELLTYFNLGNTPFYEARKKAIQRFAKKKKLELCREPMPTTKDAKGKALDEMILEWEKRNKGTYVVKRYTAGEINRTQFNFIETLLFSLKSEFVTQIALGQLYGNPNYPKKGENWSLENKRVDDKSTFKSNRKPVIAVRNTLEGIYNTLGLKVGDYIDDNDFIIYVRAIIQTALNGYLTLKEVRPDDKKVEVSDEHPIDLSDFEDKGERYLKFINDIKDVKLNIPVSPIDYLIQTIESHFRDAEKDDYGNGSPTFVVGEVTGRTKRLWKQPDGRYKLIENTRDKNKANVFKKFNNGTYDVLLINESGSTGASAHSSVKVSDQRPRVMIIHQVELDVNQEVQKRGRINRTGMVNYPTYIYAISRIPSEIRRLLMLAKKLRKLDANTTGNQKQSQALSQIKDSEGNPIEDVINKYGDEVLDEFLHDPANDKKYLQYRLSKDEKGKATLSDNFEIETYCRRLELATAKDQEYFYNTINVLYKQKVEEKKEEKIYDLETEIIDLKAAIINRVVKKQGDNTSPFNTSVYLEDNKALSQEIPLEKSEVDDLMNKLAMGEKPDEYIKSIIEDYNKEQEAFIQEELDAIEKPDLKSAKSKEEKEELKAEYEQKLSDKKTKLETEGKRIMKYFQYFKPDKSCQIPANEAECYEENEEGKIDITDWNSAKFVGIIISKAAKHKYSPINIEFVFCQLSGKPKYKVKPTAKGSVILDIIMDRIVSITALQQIGLWQVSKNERRFLKLVTGNLIQGYDVAKNIINTDEKYSKLFDFIKFTTVDNLSIRYGIRLHMTPYAKINVSSHKVLYGINQETLINIMLAPTGGQELIGINSASTVVLKITNDYAHVMFLGGLHRFRGGKEEKEPTEKKKKYFSRFYIDPIIKDIANKYGVPIDEYYDSFWITDSWKYINRLKLGVAKSNPVAKDFLKELTNYVASVLQINIELKSKSEETIEGQYDPYDEMYKDGERKQEEKEGEYIYEFLSPPDADMDKITADSKFLKYVKKEDGGGRFGTAYFKYRPKVSDAIAYSMMPMNPTPNEMIADSLSVLSDDDKIKMKSELEKAVKDGKPDEELGGIVINYIKTRVYARKVIFGGYSNKEDIGSIFRNFVLGKEAELPEQPKPETETEPEEIEAVELNMDTAQDFILLLSSKIN
jgi:hypothetical protein